jgi:hypothetical protein
MVTDVSNSLVVTRPTITRRTPFLDVRLTVTSAYASQARRCVLFVAAMCGATG